MGGGQIGPLIVKEGQKMCTPGYVLQNGICVMKPETPVCLPGWYLHGGECVKGPREFMNGEASGGGGQAYGSAPINNRYPSSKDEVLSMQRLRQYIQEKQLGKRKNKIENMSGAMTPIVIVVIVLAMIAIASVAMKKM